MTHTLEEVKEKFRTIVTKHGLGNYVVEVTIGTLTPRQAIGNPSRRDYPLLEGREVMIEARFSGSLGQAFTDRPNEYRSSLNGILNMVLDSNEKRAIFAATLNSVMAHLGLVEDTQHCHDEEPEKCAAEMAAYLVEKYGRVKVGMIGYQPAILENLVQALGADRVRCTDLNPNNIGAKKFGAEIWDGRTDTERLVSWCDIVLATSSTIVNATYDDIKMLTDTHGKRLVIFGVSGTGVSALLGLERLCFQSH